MPPCAREKRARHGVRRTTPHTANRAVNTAPGRHESHARRRPHHAAHAAPHSARRHTRPPPITIRPPYLPALTDSRRTHASLLAIAHPHLRSHRTTRAHKFLPTLTDPRSHPRICTRAGALPPASRARSAGVIATHTVAPTPPIPAPAPPAL